MGSTRVIPQTVRIKRKRNQDPIQALLVNEPGVNRLKRSRTDSAYGTFDEEPGDPSDILLQQEKPSENVYRVARTKKQRTAQGPEYINDVNDISRNEAIRRHIPPNQLATDQPEADPQAMHSLTEMVQSYLDLEKEGSLQEAKTGAQVQRQAEQVHPAADAIESTNDNEVEEYVYDIYYRQVYTGDGEPWKDTSSGIGLIVFSESDLEEFATMQDEESDIADDDEDSNAEDFYKNDYPDEEDQPEFDSDARSDIMVPDSAPLTIGEVREGDYYTGHEWNPDDDEGGEYSDEHFDQSVDTTHTPKEDDEWSEDEDMEEYRDRILGNLERQIRDNTLMSAWREFS